MEFLQLTLFLSLLLPYSETAATNSRIDVFEHGTLEIPWNYDYPSDWQRATTYWRFFNETIKEPQAALLMLKDGEDDALATNAYKGKVEELQEANGGIKVKNVQLYESGTYLIQMDFKDRTSYHNSIKVEVHKYDVQKIIETYEFVIGSDTFDSASDAEVKFSKGHVANITVRATDKTPPGTITMRLCGDVMVCNDSTVCSFVEEVVLCDGSLTVTIEHENQHTATMILTIVIVAVVLSTGAIVGIVIAVIVVIGGGAAAAIKGRDAYKKKKKNKKKSSTDEPLQPENV